MWERQTAVKLLSFLQALILPGVFGVSFCLGWATDSNHSLNWAVSEPGPGRAAGETQGWASSARSCHISLPVRSCRWQINEDGLRGLRGLRGLSLMRLWRWRGCRWKNEYFQHPSLSFISSRSLWERGRCHSLQVTKGDKTPMSILRPLVSFSFCQLLFNNDYI